MNSARPMKNIGNSILPSCAPHIMVPLGDLQVVRDEAADTHRLMRGDKIIASHPNGFSCYELAKRIAAKDKGRAVEQAQYIIDCGGSADMENIL
jgi:hypothetical protein